MTHRRLRHLLRTSVALYHRPGIRRDPGPLDVADLRDWLDRRLDSTWL